MRPLASLVIALSLAAASSHALEPVSIRLPARVMTSPAHLQIQVLVEPDASNRLLTVEVDGAPLYRSSDVPLAGDRAKRVHLFEEKELFAGNYTVRAMVYGTDGVRATTVRDFKVYGR